MRGFLLAIVAVTTALCLTQEGFAKPQKLECNPAGPENWIIGCMHNANVELWEQLNKHYSRHLDSLFEKCGKGNSGGGSGGFRDRTICVTKALEAEAKRVNYKK